MSKFNVQVSQNPENAPNDRVEAEIEAKPTGVYVRIGCQAAGLMSATGAEKVAREILSAVEQQKQLPKAGPHFEITFNDGRDRDMGPYKRLNYLEQSDELECLYSDYSNKSGQSIRYPGAVIAAMWPVEK